jgi:fructokinase
MRREFFDRVISLDINVRPTLIRNRDGYLARVDRLVAMTDIVKLSEEDLAWLAPDAAFADQAAHWLKLGAKLVVLTKGGEGAVAISRLGEVTAPGIVVKVADTVGAGDTFTAGTLARLDKRGLLSKEAVAGLDTAQIRDVLGFAAKAAAVTVSRPGANPPWLRELA